MSQSEGTGARAEKKRAVLQQDLVASDHGGLLRRLPPPLQRSIFQFLDPDEAADCGLVSKGARQLCEQYFAELKSFKDGNTVHTFTLMLRFSTRLQEFNSFIMYWFDRHDAHDVADRVAYTPQRLERLRVLLGDSSLDSLVDYVIRRNQQTLRRGPWSASPASLALLAGCPHLEQLRDWRPYGKVSKAEVNRIETTMMRILQECPELRHLEFDAQRLYGPQEATDKQLLWWQKLLSGWSMRSPSVVPRLSAVCSKPLLSLSLKGAGAVLMQAAISCPSLTALTKLVLTLRFEDSDHLRGVEQICLLCKATLRVLELSREDYVFLLGEGGTLTLDLPSLELFSCDVKSELILNAPQLRTLSLNREALDDCGVSGPASKFPKLVEFHQLQASTEEPRFVALVQWVSLQTLTLYVDRSHVDCVLRFLLAGLPQLEYLELWTREAAPRHRRRRSNDASEDPFDQIKSRYPQSLQRPLKSDRLRTLLCAEEGPSPAVFQGAALPALRLVDLGNQLASVQPVLGVASPWELRLSGVPRSSASLALTSVIEHGAASPLLRRFGLGPRWCFGSDMQNASWRDVSDAELADLLQQVEIFLRVRSLQAVLVQQRVFRFDADAGKVVMTKVKLM